MFQIIKISNGYEIDFFRCEIIFLPAPLNAEQPRHQALLTPQKLLRLISLGHTDVLKKAVTDSASGSDSPAMPDMAVREEKIQLAVEMLTCKACSEKGSGGRHGPAPELLVQRPSDQVRIVFLPDGELNSSVKENYIPTLQGVHPAATARWRQASQ